MYLTIAYDKSIFSPIGDGKSFTSLDGLRSHINTSHLPKRHECQDCAYKTNCASHLKRHRDRWHGGSTQELKTCVYWLRRLIVHVCILCLLGAVYMEGGRTWHLKDPKKRITLVRYGFCSLNNLVLINIVQLMYYL